MDIGLIKHLLLSLIAKGYTWDDKFEKFNTDFNIFLVFKKDQFLIFPKGLFNYIDKSKDLKYIIRPYISRTIKCRKFTSALKALIGNPSHKGLNKVITNKGDIYYGGKGIIFDKDFNPIFMTCINTVYNNKIIFKISNTVFKEDKLVEKGIRDIVIPLLSRDFTDNIIICNINECSVSKIEIKDYFIKDSTLNAIISSNYNEIIDNINN